MGKYCTVFRRIGSIKVPTGKIDIMDPGYGHDIWCIMQDVVVKPGKYYCYASYLVKKYSKDLGSRVVAIAIAHEDYDRSHDLNLEQIGEVGVDSALMSISASRTKPDEFPGDDGWMNFVSKFYGQKKLANIIVPDGCKDKLLVASSGFGDGLYGVYAVNSRGEDAPPDVIQVTFIEEDDLK